MRKPHHHGSMRQAPRSSHGCRLPINLRIVFPTLSISAAYLRAAEPALDSVLASRRHRSRIQASNTSALRPNGSRIPRSQIVPKLQGKSLVGLVRVPRALDLISVTSAYRSFRDELTDMLFSLGYIPEPVQSADKFQKCSRFLRASFLIAEMQLDGDARGRATRASGRIWKGDPNHSAHGPSWGRPAARATCQRVPLPEQAIQRARTARMHQQPHSQTPDSAQGQP